MSAKKITFQHRLEYGVLLAVQGLLSSIPLSAAGALVSGVIRAVFFIKWPLKKETVSRMREVFGEDFPVARMKLIARHSVTNIILNYVEIMHRRKMDADYLYKHIAGLDSVVEHLQGVIAKYGGAVVALPHMGNWDLAGITCANVHFSLMAIARLQNNPLVNKWLLENQQNFTIIDRTKPSSFVKIAHHLKNGGLFAILPDVRHNKPGVGVTVFGKADVQLGKGVSQFSRMANVPVVPLFMERVDASHHKISALEPILPDMDVDPKEDAVRLTQAIWDCFEKKIREVPEQWFWHNRRWLLTPLYTQTR